MRKNWINDRSFPGLAWSRLKRTYLALLWIYKLTKLKECDRLRQSKNGKYWGRYLVTLLTPLVYSPQWPLVTPPSLIDVVGKLNNGVCELIKGFGDLIVGELECRQVDMLAKRPKALTTITYSSGFKYLLPRPKEQDQCVEQNMFFLGGKTVENWEYIPPYSSFFILRSFSVFFFGFITLLRQTITQFNLVLSTELMMQIDHRKEFLSWRFKR